MVWSFSARAFARVFSYLLPRGDAPTTTSAAKPKNPKSRTTPIQVENKERGSNFDFNSLGVTSICGAERFEETRVAIREKRSPGRDAQKDKGERCAHSNER
jgi:hypothetical protein